MCSDNRNPPLKTTDDAEALSVAFKDNFSGWQEIKLAVATWPAKRSATARQRWFGADRGACWAFGTLGTAGPKSYYLDNVTLYGTAPIRPRRLGSARLNFASRRRYRHGYGQS